MGSPSPTPWGMHTAESEDTSSFLQDLPPGRNLGAPVPALRGQSGGQCPAVGSRYQLPVPSRALRSLEAAALPPAGRR